MAFYFYLSTKIIMVFITKSYQDLFGVRSYINALFRKNKVVRIFANIKIRRLWNPRNIHWNKSR